MSLLYDPAMNYLFWLLDYFPEALSLPSEVRVPGVDEIRVHLAVQSVGPPPICSGGSGPRCERAGARTRLWAWDARYGHLRSLPEFDLGYRLVVAE